MQKYQVDVFNCSYRQLSEEWIKDLQWHQIPCWSIRSMNRTVEELIERGVSGIFDFPEELMKIVEKL